MRTTPFLVAVGLLIVACTPVSDEGLQLNPKASLETYENTDLGYTIDIPSDWEIRENEVITDGHTSVLGTSFVYPAAHDSSALMDAKLHIGTTAVCPSQDGGVMEDINGVSFMRTRWSGNAAGNVYEGETYQHEIADDKCLVITLYTQSCNLSPADCGPGHELPKDTDSTIFKLKWAFQTLSLD